MIDSKWKEHIFMFAQEQWIIADNEAVEFNESAQLKLDCLEDTEVIISNKYQLHKDDFLKEKIIDNTQLLNRRLAKLQRRVMMLLSSTAIERYIYFLDTYPELPNRVPQK